MWYSDNEKKLANIGFVHIHEPSRYWDEDPECLTGCRIVFDKWAGKVVTLRETDFYLIPEAAVLAIIEGESV